MNEDPYVYPGTSVLRNRFGLTDAADLDRVERLHTVNRGYEPIPRGSFDLAHLRAIHRHLFQDIYEWAGELRTVEISKGRQQFQFRKFIETGMADVHGRLVRSRFLNGLAAAPFAEAAAVIVGDINYIHPFREGNGRTQLQYLKQLAEQAGHRLDLGRIDGSRWLEASIASHSADYAPMAAVLLGALKGAPGGR
ncbi:MAG TPA: Fic family protein [Xanthobacteraceae bacterium]|nr:Fic family protein [Xanthobacteraceae bacterium]